MLAGARSSGMVSSRPRCNDASVLPQASFPERLQPLCQPHVPSKTPPAFCATISKLQPTVADDDSRHPPQSNLNLNNNNSSIFIIVVIITFIIMTASSPLHCNP
ncbi:hypothetical protein LA080_013786 [Diaporthe eres]|nr:hypothetical protein LA080_013786 [Diaporthe eres]